MPILEPSVTVFRESIDLGALYLLLASEYGIENFYAS